MNRESRRRDVKLHRMGWQHEEHDAHEGGVTESDGLNRVDVASVPLGDVSPT